MEGGSRRILPRPDAAESDAGLEDGEGQQQEHQQQKMQKRKRTQVAAACERCRSRKHRCDGLRPACSPCVAKNLQCQYRLPAGETHDSYRRRQVEQLHHDASELESVVRTIREAPDDVTQALVRQLKESTTIGEAIASIVRDVSYSQATSVRAHPFLHKLDIQAARDQAGAGGYASSGAPRTASFASPSSSEYGVFRGADGRDGAVSVDDLKSASQHDLEPDLMSLTDFDETASDLPVAVATRHGWHWCLRSTKHATSSVGRLGQRPEDLAPATTSGGTRPYPAPAAAAPAAPSTVVLPVRNRQAPEAGELDVYRFPGAPEAFGSLPPTASYGPASQYHPGPQEQPRLLTYQKPEWGFLPLSVVPDDCPMATMPAALRHAALEEISAGRASVQSVLGAYDLSFDGFPVYVDLFFRDKGPNDVELNVCDFASELFKGMSVDFDRFVLLANIAAVARYLRWAILPSQTNFAQLPVMMRPLPCQRLVPHTPALDLCPHPGMREALIREYRDWITPGSTTVAACHVWPFGLDEAVEVDVDGKRRLTKRFESWVTEPRNWTFNQRMYESFPDAEEFDIVIRQS